MFKALFTSMLLCYSIEHHLKNVSSLNLGFLFSLNEDSNNHPTRLIGEPDPMKSVQYNTQHSEVQYILLHVYFRKFLCMKEALYLSLANSFTFKENIEIYKELLYIR